MKLSIITIVRNGESEIAKTLENVILQKNSDVEYIVVDGKSTDSTLAIINRYRGSIDQIISEEDTGISDAFNKGIRAAKGDYVWLINCGDLLTDSGVSDVLAQLTAHSDILYGDIYIKKRNGDLFTKLSDQSKITRFMSIGHPATIVKRAVYEKIGGFDENLKIAMDFDFLFRCHNAGYKFSKIDKRLAIMEAGGVSDTRWVASVYETHKVRIKNNVNWLSSTVYLIQSLVHAGFFRLNSLVPKQFRFNRRDKNQQLLN